MNILENYFTLDLKSGISKLDFDIVNEIRLRAGCQVIVTIGLKKYYLGKNGLTSMDNAIIVTNTDLEEFLMRACEHSVYAVSEYIKKGFVTIDGGIRVGLTGTVIYSAGEVLTIRDINSICIRIPHEIKNCALPALQYIYQNGIKNTLILSRPGAGKTTFLKDLIYQLDSNGISLNCLVLDEREELNVKSRFVDRIIGAEKKYAISSGIRSMRPDVIICDEIDLNVDLPSIIDACSCGVNVVATIHAKDIMELKRKKGFDYIFENRIFDRYIVLDNIDKIGNLVSIYNENLNCIYSR